jgi:nitroreductase
MLETIKARRSIRKFKADPVTKEQLDILLEAAMHAPSAVNSRPWEFVAITKREILDQIAEAFPNAHMCAAAPAAIAIVALPAAEKVEGFFAQDCGAAAQNILLAAHEIGLGSCWCGIYPREDKPQRLAAILSVEEGKVPFCVIALGVADEAPEARGFFEAGKVRYV